MGHLIMKTPRTAQTLYLLSKIRSCISIYNRSLSNPLCSTTDVVHPIRSDFSKKVYYILTLDNSSNVWALIIKQMHPYHHQIPALTIKNLPALISQRFDMYWYCKTRPPERFLHTQLYRMVGKKLRQSILPAVNSVWWKNKSSQWLSSCVGRTYSSMMYRSQ